MAGIGSLLKGATKGAKAIQEAAEASKLAPPRLNWSADNLDAIGAIPNVYDYINNPGYQLREKDRQIEIVMMSPDEYINEAARILSSGSSESTAADVIQQRARNFPRIQGIQDLLDQGEDFQIPFLDYKRGGQEGLHRAMAAKNLGEESIPVMIMRSARGEDRVPLPKNAIDNQNAVIESIMAPLQEEISAILDLAKQHGTVYVRWAGNKKHDLSKGARSRDYQTGEMHQGLSAVGVTADMSPSDVAGRLHEYGYGRAAEPNSRPRVYLADKVGIDSDGYFSIRPRRLLREPSDETLMALDSGGAKLLVLEERLSDALGRAPRITDPIAKKLTQELIDKTRQEIAEARQNIVKISAKGARKAGDMVAGGIVKGAAKQARRIGEQFDPRFDPRKKEQERLQNLEVAVEPRQLDRPQVSIADFEGYPFVTSMSDRSAAGGLLTEVRGVPLSQPVDLRGGQDFMFDYNPGQVWASGKGQAADILSVAKEAGRDPLFLPWRMAPTGGDFATMTGETMLSFARDSMNKKTKRSLDSKLKKIIPNWPGIDSPDAIDVFRAAPDRARKAAKNMMDVEFRDRGGLSIGEARLAVTDPAQLDAQQGGVQNVGRILTDLEMDFSTHPTYPMAVPGEGVGVLKEDINVFELLPDIVETRGIPDPLRPRDTDLRSMQMGAKSGVITSDVLRKILGGGAGAALGIETLLQEEAQAGPLKAQNMAIGGIVKKAAILAPVNDIGLYSKAEDVAKKMRQAKGRGDDVRRFFKKQGVRDEEIDALGLDRLFRQARVTQQEILDQIDQNRVVMEERVSAGPSTGTFDFDYEYEDLTIDEAYGQSYINEEVSYYLNDEPEMFIFDDGVIDDYIRRLAPGLDRESDDALRTLLKDYGEGTGDFDDLPDAIQEDLERQAQRLVEMNYDENPVRRITLTAVDPQDGDTQNVGDMRGASFSYSLIGNEDTGYGLSGLEYNDVPANIRAQLDNANIFSMDEARVQLQAIANEYDDFEDFAPGDTSWGQYTLGGGENYQEARLSLPDGGQTKFRENVHFPDDINNVFHVRTKDRVGPTGERILYVEEVQSDWAQTGRKKGFMSPEKVEEAERASAQLLEEAMPLIEQIDQSRIFDDGAGFGNSFLGSLSSLSSASRRYRSGNRPLDAAADVFVALSNADREAKIRTVDVLQEDFLDSLTDEQAVDLYVRELMGEFEGGERTRESLRRMYGDNYRAEAEREARERLAQGGGSYLNSVLIRAGEKTGALPKKNPEGLASIRDNPQWNEAFERILQERERYLASNGVDPKLMSKLQAALDRTDPEGAKIRQGKEQRGLPQEGPFVLDTDSWNKLAVKYIFKKAAEEGYDGVSFAPGQVHVDRWADPGLRVQYDQNIPSAIDKVIGPAPNPASNMPDTMVVDGYESKIYRLSDPTKDGESILEKMKAPTTMFGFAPLPLVLPGIAALQGLSPEQAQEEKRKFEEFGRAFPSEAGPQPLPEALSTPVVADRATQRLIDAGFPREMAEQIVMGGSRPPQATFVPPPAQPINISAGIEEDLFGAPELTPPAPAAAMPQPGQDEVPDYMRRLDGSIKSERGFLGPIQNKVSGRTMTEVSVGQPGSEEGFYPLLVPTLTQEEIDTIANLDLGRERPPQAIIEKARAHAMDRTARGMSPFYQDDEPFDFRDASARSLAQENVFGDYDQRATAIASQALDRLLLEAQMREGEIGPQEVLEAAATIGSSILGSVPAGLAGLYTLATTGDLEAAVAKINEITESLTYMPSSQGSMDALQAVAGPLEALAAPSEFMGQQTLDVTGSPLLATAAEIFLDPLNLLTFGGLGKALKRAGRAQ